jgi:hypothetical protein
MRIPCYATILLLLLPLTSGAASAVDGIWAGPFLTDKQLALFRKDSSLGAFVYVKNVGGKWVGIPFNEADEKDSLTERVFIYIKENAYAKANTGHRDLPRGVTCQERPLPRDQYGYNACNSAYFKAGKFDPDAFRRIVEESDAVQHGIEQWRLMHYRRAFQDVEAGSPPPGKDTTINRLKAFVEAYGNLYDPDGLVKHAQSRLDATRTASSR